MPHWDSMRSWYEQTRTDFLDRCTSCGICVDVCPIFRMGDWSGRSASQLHDERLDALRSGGVTELARSFTFACIMCAECKLVCPEKLDAFELTNVMRWALREAGAEVPEGLLASDPRSLTAVCSALQTKPSDVRWMTKVEENTPIADTVLFLGCSILGMPDKVHTLLDVLDILGLNIPVVGGPQLCCGITQFARGDIEGTEHQLRVLVESLARFHPKKVVFWCNGCYGKVQLTAPHFVDVPFENQHIASFLCEHLDRLPFQKLDKKVTVHDPCTARVLGEYGGVRRLLGAIPGLEVVEMENNRENALCCGTPTQAILPDVAKTLTDLAMGQAKDTKASTLATICQGCQRRFGRQEKQYPFVVESFITLVGEALEIHYEDRLKRFLQYRDPERVIAESVEQIAASGYQPAELEGLVRRYFK